MATRKYTKSLPERTNHGESKTPEYAAWRDMRHRCRNSTLRDWHLYGGRGISVCPQWVNDYLQFKKDMGPRPSPAHSLDRINSDGPYSPENCRWALFSVQQNNRSNNRLLSIEGVQKTVSEWAQSSGVRYGLIMRRLNLGWPDKDAVFHPPLPVGVNRRYQ